MSSVNSTVSITTSKKTIIYSIDEIKKIEKTRLKKMKKYVNELVNKNKEKESL